MYYVTMQITFPIPEFARKERNLHCDVVHVTTCLGGWTVQSIQQPVPSPDKRGGLASGRASGHKTFAIKSKCRDSQRIRVGLGRTP